VCVLVMCRLLCVCLCVIVNYVLEFMYLHAVLLSVRASADGGLVVLISWLFLYALVRVALLLCLLLTA
jgi:hypothetical protein